MTLATSGPAIIQRLKAAGLSVRPTAPPSPLMQAFYLLETFWLLLGAFQEVQPCLSSEQESTWHSSCGPWHGTNMPILPNMNMFEEKIISLLKIHHFVKNGGNRGFLNEISWGFFFGHSSYKTEPSEKISAGHDLIPGYTLERLD
ncbi:hypothetical protein GQR58_005563 [Nymphon striatum]|nr:hypothetical protein GQR58_005563 [Nymphon striatum]